jgi:hypothetical protein
MGMEFIVSEDICFFRDYQAFRRKATKCKLFLSNFQGFITFMLSDNW